MGQKDACSLEPEVGRCREFVRRWAFKPVVGECAEFVYGGCGGNANNFVNKEACEARCVGMS